MSAPASLNLLVFSVAGVRFGCDADQAEGVAAYRGDQGDELCWFHEELGFGGPAPEYGEPSVVTVRTADAGGYRVIIDRMEDLVEVTLDDISPFPQLMEPFVLAKGMWGVVEREGGMILLVDFLRLLHVKGAPGNEALQGG